MKYQTFRPHQVFGLRPLTNAYTPKEYWMMDNVIADLTRGGIGFVLVVEQESTPEAISVFRSSPTHSASQKAA